jgi:small GTP-binding protein
MGTKNSSNNKRNIKKIVLVGLDNSGKTSILLSLTRNTNLLSYYSLKPTPGLNIVNYSDEEAFKFSIWDMGGQEKYRQEYFQDLDKYLNADKIIFVIDVQDLDRYDLALYYLAAFVDALEQKNKKVDFSIFLHKFDPSLEDQPNFTDEQIQANLLSRIQAIFPPDYTYDLYKTTIYTVFQKKPILRV